MTQVETPTLNVIARVKDDGHQFVFLFDNDGIKEAIKSIGEFAADQDLSFDWIDAAVCCRQMRQIERLGVQ